MLLRNAAVELFEYNCPSTYHKLTSEVTHFSGCTRNMHYPSEDEGLIEDYCTDDESSAYSVLQSIYGDFSDGDQDSARNPEAWLPREDWPDTTAFHSHPSDNAAIAASRPVVRASKVGSTHDNEGRASLEPAPTIALEALVDRLLQPGGATNESNDICAAIMLHADLSENCSGLKHYSNMSLGLRECTPFSPHAWLYTPRRMPKRMAANGESCETVTEGLAMIFVYPNESCTASRSTNATCRPVPSKTGLYFGGRTYSLGGGSVLLQHGSHQHLGCVIPFCSYR